MPYLYNRAWNFIVSNRLTRVPILSLTQLNPLRVSFSVTATPDMFMNYGTIKFYNLPARIRNLLHYRALRNGVGKGNLITMAAGYEGIATGFFQGAIHDCYSVQQGSDILTIAEVNVEIGKIEKRIQSIKKEALKSAAAIANAVKNILIQAFTDTVTGNAVPLAATFLTECQTALTQAATVKLDYSLAPTGSIDEIVRYLSSRLKIRIYRNSRGSISCAPQRLTPAPFIDTTAPPLILTIINGVVGDPVEYQTGVKYRTLLRPELSIFQTVNFIGKHITRNLITQRIIHSGDTHEDDWYSDIDGIHMEILQ